jgi:hypothetical protein
MGSESRKCLIVIGEGAQSYIYLDYGHDETALIHEKQVRQET